MYLLVWLVYFVGLCVAGYPRLMHAQLWAEDGRLFLAQEHRWHLGAMLVPYDGYLHTVPRLLAFVLMRLFGTQAFASAVCVTSYAILAGVCAQFARPVFAWLVPGRMERILIAALVVFAPGLCEVLGNLTNLHYVLLVGCALYALRDVRAPTSRWAFGAVGLACLSEGACWLLLLPFGLGAWVKRSCFGVVERRERALLLIIVAAGALHIAAYVHGLGDVSAKGREVPTAETWVGLLRLVVERFALVPWGLGWGDQRARLWGTMRELGLGAPVLGLVGWALWRRLGVRRALWAASMSLTPVALLLLTFIVRPGTLALIVEHPLGYPPRYAFATFLPALVLWATALQALGPRWGRRGVMLMVAAQLSVGIGRLPYSAYQPLAPRWDVAWRAYRWGGGRGACPSRQTDGKPACPNGMRRRRRSRQTAVCVRARPKALDATVRRR